MKLAFIFLIFAIDACASRAPQPAPLPSRVQVGVASWYGPGFHGKRTSNGEVYDQHDLTAAHQTLPMGTRVAVTNLDNGRSVEVRINDRGPFAKDRIIDLSYASASALGLVGPGTARVRLEVLGDTEPRFEPLLYTVQVGSFAEPARARDLRDHLAARFDDVYVVPFRGNEASYYRVRLGRFRRRAEAAAAAQRVAALGFSAIIMEDDGRR